MAGEKGLDYYLNNPDEMPDDISALASALSSDAEPQEPETAVEESVSADAVEPVAVEDVKEAPNEADALIETKQGKPAIPYAVLANERERRQAAEQAVESLRQELNALSARVEQGSAAGVETDAPVDVEGQDIDKLVSEFPEFGAVVKALATKTRALEQQLARVSQIENARIEQDQRRSAGEVQEVIDSIPELRYWQAENPELWGEAARLDDMIKANPANQSLTLSERFEKVVVAIEAIYGKADLPDAYKPPKAPDTSIEQVAAKAKAVVEKAGSFKPKTLSDMPGGSIPPTSERDRVSAMSPSELERMMSSMDSDQLAAFIAKAA